MDPITFGIELEIGTLLLAAVGAIATFLQHRHHKQHQRQRERHFQEMMARSGKVVHEEVSLLRDIDRKETAPRAANASRARNSRANSSRPARATAHAAGKKRNGNPS